MHRWFMLLTFFVLFVFFVERNVELSFYHTYVYTFKEIITEILTVYS